MKPDKTTCGNCGKDIPKGKWCSDKCRMANKRTPKPEQNVPEQAPKQSKPEQIVEKGEQTRTRTQGSGAGKHGKTSGPDNSNNYASLTATDWTFYDRAMRDFGEPYYIFDQPVNERKCIMPSCGKRFTTQMSLLNYCSYDHYTQAIAGRK